MDFLGWYTTGEGPNESDIHVHKQICEINESPVILKLNPFPRNSDLPVTMFESVIDLVNGAATMLFVELTYTLATEEAERIGVDHVARMATGEGPNESDIHVHKQICEINESPVILKLNPFPRNSDLPVTMFESVIDLVNGAATMLFVELTYTLATEEAERIGVDHVARMASGDLSESSQVAEQLQAQHNAVKMLANRVRLILEYIKAMERGEVPKSHEVLREAKSLTHRLPVLNSETFQEEYYTQYNDVLLQTYLASITKACHDLHQFVNKFNILCDRQGMGRRMRGLFF
nr:EOG090X08T4 [Polyphemus pediculus]